jgi:hypothetical protein
LIGGGEEVVLVLGERVKTQGCSEVEVFYVLLPLILVDLSLAVDPSPIVEWALSLGCLNCGLLDDTGAVVPLSLLSDALLSA